jgi:hypothetical protein
MLGNYRSLSAEDIAAEHAGLELSYRTAIAPKESFLFTLEGVVQDIEAGRTMQHRELSRNDPLGTPLDLRIGYEHWMNFSMKVGGALEQLTYKGTPPGGLRSGDTIKAFGWQGKLVRAPLFLFSVGDPDVPTYGYMLDASTPRSIHRIEIITPKGMMAYGPKLPDFPRPPMRRELDMRTPHYTPPATE